MASPQKPVAKGAARPRWTINVARILLLIALLLSGYLTWASFGGGAVAGCGPESGCDKVLQSRWSRWFGIPVSLLAAFLYAVLLAAALRLTPAATVPQQRNAWRILLSGACAVIGAVVWFVALQLVAIKAVCPFCMAAHASGLAAAIILLFSAPVQAAPKIQPQRDREIYIEPRRARSLIIVAVTGVTVLAGGQLIYQSKQFRVTPVQAGSLQQVQTNRYFEIYQGRFVFNLNEAPLIGSPTAPRAMVSLFDYTCHHCRLMHDVLKQAHRTFSNELAIISLPMPLDSACNYTVRLTPPAHTNACDYARFGLAVWRANRAVHPRFDDWLFELEHPPPLEEARQFARQLAGPANFDAALTNRWIDDYLQLGINVYATNFFHVRQGAMPQVIIGTNLLTGTVTLDDMYRHLEQQLGLKRSPDAR